MYEIDKHIPTPKKREVSIITKTMREMDIGDSFIIESNHQNGLHQKAKTAKIRIQTRKECEFTIRVWRIE